MLTLIGVDSGNFMGYPSMFLSVPDEQGFCFTQAFQSIGLGLATATATGAALARPDRLPVAALGDGGVLMAAAELDTVQFPSTDIAAIARGHGFTAVTVTEEVGPRAGRAVAGR